MRAINILVLAVALIGCSHSDVPADGVYAETIGSLERLNPDDPQSPWVGEEVVRIVGDGELLCDGDAFLDAEADRGNGEEVSLEVIRSPAKDLAEACHRVVDVSRVDFSPRYVMVVPSARGLSAGRVLESDSPHGPWTDLAGGIYDGDRIGFRRVERLDTDVDIEVADYSDWRPRELASRD